MEGINKALVQAAAELAVRMTTEVLSRDDWRKKFKELDSFNDYMELGSEVLREVPGLLVEQVAQKIEELIPNEEIRDSMREYLKNFGLESNSAGQSLDIRRDIANNRIIRNITYCRSGDVCLLQNGTTIFAVKFLDAERGDEQWFQREIDSLKELSNPFITKLRGYSVPSPETDNKFVIIMDHVSGCSLQDMLEVPMQPTHKVFDNTAKTKIICGIALGMRSLHSKSIIHRELKASNIIIDEHNLPHITEFESSRVARTDDSSTSAPQVMKFYDAPELYEKDGKYTNKVDVYAFGVILYEIVTGKLAFRKLSPPQLMRRILISKQREPIPEHVTPFTRGLIERCWEEDPSDRPSFEDICTLLRQRWDELFPDISADEMQSFITEYW